jgi:hypothetical protein
MRTYKCNKPYHEAAAAAALVSAARHSSSSSSSMQAMEAYPTGYKGPTVSKGVTYRSDDELSGNNKHSSTDAEWLPDAALSITQHEELCAGCVGRADHCCWWSMLHNNSLVSAIQQLLWQGNNGLYAKKVTHQMTTVTCNNLQHTSWFHIITATQKTVIC